MMFNKSENEGLTERVDEKSFDGIKRAKVFLSAKWQHQPSPTPKNLNYFSKENIFL